MSVLTSVPELSLVIPCYNEERNVPLIFARLDRCLDGRRDVEVVLVDNGSTDGSAAVLDAELARRADGPYRLVRVPVNQGYGHGILQGLAVAQGRLLAWTHADLQTDPADALRALERWSVGTGDRIVKGRRESRRVMEALFTFGMQVVAWLALGSRLDDINAQPKLFPREFHERFLRAGAPKDFALDLYLLHAARTHGWSILEVPVVFGKRQHGEAKGGGSWRTRIKLIRRTFAYIFELRRGLRAG